MAHDQRTIIRRLLPTAHKILLNRHIEPRLLAVTGDVLVIGAGKEPYPALMPASSSIHCTDIEPGAGIDTVADAHALPFPDGSYDAVIAIEVFEHLRDPKIASSEMYRVLRSGGTAIVTIPFMFRVHGDPHDYQRFTASGLEALFGGGFETDIQPFGNRLQVISDLLTTATKFMAILRFLNHILCLRPFDGPSFDCASGYIVRMKKRMPQIARGS